eukprot:TRINITY_DN54728_c0_g2_i1.p1 TRINITY_DN54728_c0_g2~~TRINITY_DN54728_c0_g2_i1.p1  ORF type:complete len:403 (-),score=89.32 TRINITY_DN54728_c0_g2_i1:78-1286(-)
METILEHIAFTMNADPIAIREVNMLTKEQVDKGATVPSGRPITHYTMPQIWADVKSKAKYDDRKKAVAEFNATNRWRKRGLSMVPVRYMTPIFRKSAKVNVYADGSVIIHHTGVEVGQGLNTRVIQAAQYALGKATGDIPGDGHFTIADVDTHSLPNGNITGGSTATEGTLYSVAKCCDILVERMKPALKGLLEKQKEEKKEGQISWKELAGAAVDSANLSATWDLVEDTEGHHQLPYDNYGACCSEVEVDLLTGEVETLFCDLTYDCGVALTPNIDIGQVEGAFIMGLGHVLYEEEFYTDSGKLVSSGTWEYKPPMARDIPHEWHVRLLPNSNFEKGVMGSKAVGEPPLVLANSVAMAVRDALTASQKEEQGDSFMRLDIPLTPPTVAEAANVSINKLTLA